MARWTARRRTATAISTKAPGSAGLAFATGRAGVHLAYVLSLSALAALASGVLAATLLNGRDYRGLLIDFVRQIDPGLDAERLELSLFRSHARVSLRGLEWSGASARTVQLGIGWRQLLGLGLTGQPLSDVRLRLRGVDLAVREGAEGAWSLVGPARGGDGPRARWADWRAAAAAFGELAVDDGRVRVRTADGAEHVVALESMRLRRDDSDRIRASARLRATADAPTAAVIHALLDPAERSASVSVHALSLPRFRLARAGAIGALDDINLRASVRYRDRRRWQVSLGPSWLAQRGKRVGIVGGQVNRHDDVLHIATDYLDIQAIAAFLLDGQWLPASAHAALETMRPAGAMRGVHAIAALSGADDERTRLFARLRDVRMSPWGIVPGVSSFDGVLNVGATEGSISFVSASASISTPVLFDAALGPYTKLQGTIHWAADRQRRLRMRADPLILEQAGGGGGRLMIDASTVLADTAAIEVSLMAGWRDIDIADALGYLPKIVNRQVREQLDDTLRDGLLSGGGLSYRTTLGAAADDRQIDDLQLYVEIRDGVVDLVPGLPVAEQVNGTLTLDNDDAYFNLESFRAGTAHWIASGPVHGHANVDRLPSPDGRPAKRRYDIAAHNLTLRVPLLNEQLEHMSLQIEHDGSQWDIALRHPGIKARMMVPEDPQAPSLLVVDRLALQELRFSSATDTADAPPNVNGWFDVDVDIQSIKIGRNTLGPIYFQMRSSPNKLSFRKVHAYVGDLAITGVDNGYGDHMTWVRSATGDHSELSARIRFGNLGALLSSFDLPPYLQSREGQVDARLRWNGHIAAASPLNLSGEVEFDFEKGLLEADERSSGLLRAITALDLNRWLLQTLKRESSLYSDTGIEYDRIQGALTLRKGRASIKDQIRLENPSTDIALSGHANLRTGAVRGSLTATLPAAENLGWLATLGGMGAPVAVAVHFLSRMFGRQVSQFATSSYRINGTWKEPKIRLAEVFDGAE